MARRRLQVSDLLLGSSNGPFSCLISYLFVRPSERPFTLNPDVLLL